MKKYYFLLLLFILATTAIYAQRSKEDWVNFVTQKEEYPMLISSNLWYSYNGKPNYKNLLVVGTSTKNCKKNGYPDFLGMAKMYSFSDSIANILNKLTKNRLVGVLTYKCSGFDVYYIKDTTNVKKNLQEFLDYNYALSKNYLKIQYDKKWKYYNESLVPKDLSDVFFTNHEFITHLVTEGDKLSEERKISHYINFKGDKRRQRFINRVKTFKFAVDSTSFNKKSRYKYELIISRKDKATPDVIMKLTDELSKLALLYVAVYDGWGSEAIKED